MDALGNLARFALAPGQAHDLTGAEPLRDGVPAKAVVADKAYDAIGFINAIHDLGAQAVIAPRATSRFPREFDAHVYKGRNLVERFFCRIKHVRRIATRYEKLDARYKAFVAAAAILIWLA